MTAASFYPNPDEMRIHRPSGDLADENLLTRWGRKTQRRVGANQFDIDVKVVLPFAIQKTRLGFRLGKGGGAL
jgi:hypothetical protein